MSTVACPSHAIVILLSDHSFGFGFAGDCGTLRRASAMIVLSQRADRLREVAAQYAAHAAPAVIVITPVINLRRLRCIQCRFASGPRCVKVENLQALNFLDNSSAGATLRVL